MFLAVGVGAVNSSATDPPQNGYRYSLKSLSSLWPWACRRPPRGSSQYRMRRTTTFTQLIAATMIDSSIGGGKGSHIGRRILLFAAILAGAIAGTLFVVAGHIVPPLLIAAFVTAPVAVTAWLSWSSTGRWTSFSG